MATRKAAKSSHRRIQKQALRAQGVEEASETKRIVLEASGAISVIKKRKDSE